jgi:hypothetical protein
MAEDINNTTVANASGNQKIGNVSVFTGGKVKTSTTHSTEEIAITGIADKYEDRFDDPTYY